MIKKKHATCENHQTEIDWYFTNAHGMPALVCKQCRSKKGPRKNKPKFISWLNERECFMVHYGANWQKYYEAWWIEKMKAEAKANSLGQANQSQYGDTADRIAEERAFSETMPYGYD